MWLFIVWFFDEALIFLQQTWDSFISSFAFLVESIPVPDFMQNVSALSLPSSVLFYASAFNLPIGLGIIVSAYIVRFFIRRIPLVG